MAVLLGDSLNSPLAVSDRAGQDAFRQLMIDMDNRRDRAIAMTRYVAAVAACTRKPFTVADLARTTSAFARNRDAFRNLLDRAAWRDDPIRLGLLNSALSAGVIAISIEIHSKPGGKGIDRDWITLVALGESWSIPVGWDCAVFPPPVAGVVEADRGAVLGAVDALIDDWRQLCPNEPLPPLIARDSCLGEDHELRSEMRARQVEYRFEVFGDFVDAEPVLHPYATAERGRTLAELLRPDSSASVLVAELEAASRSDAEYAVAIPGGGFALAHPRLGLPAGVLSGERPQQRAKELAELQIPTSSFAEDLGVASFLHESTPGALRHAWLMSAAAVAGKGRFIQAQVTGI